MGVLFRVVTDGIKTGIVTDIESAPMVDLIMQRLRRPDGDIRHDRIEKDESIKQDK